MFELLTILFFFAKTFGIFFFPIANLYIYIYIIFEKKLTIFNIKRLKKTHPKKKKKKQTNPWLYLRLALGTNLVRNIVLEM
jgi:hypothetical protein